MGLLGDFLIKEATREVAKEFRKEVRGVLRAVKDKAVEKGKRVHNWYKHERTWKEEVIPEDERDSNLSDDDMKALRAAEAEEEELLKQAEEKLDEPEASPDPEDTEESDGPADEQEPKETNKKEEKKNDESDA